MIYVMNVIFAVLYIISICTLFGIYYFNRSDFTHNLEIQNDFIKTIYLVGSCSLLSGILFLLTLYFGFNPYVRGIYYTQSVSDKNNQRIISYNRCQDLAYVQDICRVMYKEITPYTITYGKKQYEHINEDNEFDSSSFFPENEQITDIEKKE